MAMQRLTVYVRGAPRREPYPHLGVERLLGKLHPNEDLKENRNWQEWSRFPEQHGPKSEGEKPVQEMT